jgi:stage III sporulation protein AC
MAGPGVIMIAQVFGIGILVSILDSILKKAGREDLSHWLTIAGLIGSMVIVIPQISSLINAVQVMFNIY